MSMWGLSEWRGPLVIALVDQASRVAAEEAGEELLDKANEHVPYDTGELKDSGAVGTEQNRESGGEFASGWASFVSYDTQYAVPLHEHPEFDFQGQGEGKWLENALNGMEGQWPTQLAPRLIEVFRLP